ncbi:MAG TPA: response regulator [Anaerolineaceae bacterium]|nr:response regulator [Anaerolineaceae bacterium]
MQKILIIEDEDSVRANIIELLEAEGYSAIGAEDGMSGVKLAREKRPDLIICDILMPRLDGYGVWGMLSKEPGTATIPLIYLTAKTDRADLRKGMDLGADDYITKPYTREELLRAIRTRLARRDALNVQAQKKLNDLRSSITLSLPHEMLTPLSVILGFSEYLVTDASEINLKQVVDIAGEIHGSAQRLLRMIQNYLMFAELELLATDAKKLDRLKESRVDSAETVIMEIADFKARSDGRNETLHLNLVDAPVNISENYLQKIVEELLDNAFKYSPEESEVSLVSRIEAEKGTYELSVSDHGRGMSIEQIGNISGFMQFDRKVYEQQGIGLGLVIVRRLADLYQGHVEIESEPGKGTQVRVHLPLCA